MFSRDFRRPKRAKFKIYLNFEGLGLPLWLSLWGGGGVPWVQVVGSCSLSLGVFRPFLSAFALFPASLSCFAFQICLISRLRGFLEGFMVRMYVCMGLGFCVDCGAFVCVSG